MNHLQPLYIAGQVFAEIRGQDTDYNDGRSPPMGHSVPGSTNMEPNSRQRQWHRQSLHRTANEEGSVSSLTASENSSYAAEKIALLRHLGKIEQLTGWKTSDRARELRLLWGLEF